MEAAASMAEPGSKRHKGENVAISDIDSFGRVLSIQSHCVHSIVGNRSAVFPLQVLRFDVDPINSVQFSNHTGYAKGFKGDVLNGDQLQALVAGLEMNGILGGYSHLLTGFIGSESFLQQVLDVQHKLKQANPALVYFCDPVLGDKGKLYVPKGLVAMYREKVVPTASVLTPNQFELELLSEVKVTDLASARTAFAALHARGVRTVILTSCEFKFEGAAERSLYLFASIAHEDGGAPQLIRAEMPRINCHFTGTGDLIAALLLAWTTRCPDDLPSALRRACTSMHAAVSLTKKAIDAGRNPNKELLLVQSRTFIESPDLANTPVIVETL